MADTIEQRVIQIIAQQLNVPIEDIKNDSSFISDLGASESEYAAMIAAFEDEFILKIPESSAENFYNVQNVIIYIKAWSKEA